MEKFAGYGFNKSHAAAYALLAYHTAWLKVHCPAEFYAANMTVEIDNTDKLKVLIDDAKQFGVAFEPPDVNRGTYRFEPVDDKRVRYGLGAVKGTGQGAIEAIVARARRRRGRRPFRSLFDFCARVDRQRVNKRAVEALVKAGAFDALHAGARAGCWPASAWPSTGPTRRRSTRRQGGLFDFGDSHAASDAGAGAGRAPSRGASRSGCRSRRRRSASTCRATCSSSTRAEVRQFAKRRIADLVDCREPQLLAGIVSDLRVVNGQRGRVAIFKLDDRSERIEAVANEELLDDHARAAARRRAAGRAGQGAARPLLAAACG